MTWLAIFCLGFWLEPNDFVMVVSQEVPIESLTNHQLQQIFLGTLDRVDDIEVHPIMLRAKDSLQIAFEKAVFGAAFDLENYWLTQKIRLGTPTPRIVRHWALVMAYVQRNPGFIGYVPATAISELGKHRLKVVAIKGP